MRLFSLAVLAIGLGAGQAAANDVYNCVMTKFQEGSWVPEQIVIAKDDKAGGYVVFDPLINHFVGQPMKAETGTDNAKRLTVKWTLENIVNGSGQRALRFQYRATVLRGNNQVIVRAKPVGYGNEFEGRGKCTLQQGKG